MTFLIVLTLIIVAASLFIFLVKGKDEGDLKKMPTAPDRRFLIGHFGQISSAEPGIMQRKWSQSLPFGIFMTYYFWSPRVYVTDPKALSRVRILYNIRFTVPSYFDHIF